MPEHYPDFPSAQQMRDYLRPDSQFRTKVVLCVPLADGRWEVELASGEPRRYNGVI